MGYRDQASGPVDPRFYAEYLESARSAFREEHGSIGDYVRALGVRDETLDRLRSALLEPAASQASAAPEAP